MAVPRSGDLTIPRRGRVLCNRATQGPAEAAVRGPELSCRFQAQFCHRVGIGRECRIRHTRQRRRAGRFHPTFRVPSHT